MNKFLFPSRNLIKLIKHLTKVYFCIEISTEANKTI